MERKLQDYLQRSFQCKRDAAATTPKATENEHCHPSCFQLCMTALGYAQARNTTEHIAPFLPVEQEKPAARPGTPQCWAIKRAQQRPRIATNKLIQRRQCAPYTTAQQLWRTAKVCVCEGGLENDHGGTGSSANWTVRRKVL